MDLALVNSHRIALLMLATCPVLKGPLQSQLVIAAVAGPEPATPHALHVNDLRSLRQL